MKRHLCLLALALAVAMGAQAQDRAKYVFYFIGDGMGVNQVNAAETYQSAIKGEIGIEPLAFPAFPHVALVNTQSATNGVTDSAAGGTALATGHKTKNGALGVLKDQTTPVTSLADWAREAGAAVGISTTVSIDNATPAAFYAHIGDRNKTYEIGQQLTLSKNDFYAGSDFVKPDNPQGGDNLYEQAAAQGFTIARGPADYKVKAAGAKRMILFQTEEASRRERGSVPYAVDRAHDDMTLTDITLAGIDFLTTRQKDGKDGFLLMVEGGKIDWACHKNDLTFIHEVIDMDYGVREAMKFYERHPDETLIVVTADHETGGLSLGRKGYNINLRPVQLTRVSFDAFPGALAKFRADKGGDLTWDDFRQFLADRFGFWSEFSKLDDSQTQRLQDAFADYVAPAAEGAAPNPWAARAKLQTLQRAVNDTANEVALVNWGTPDHSDGYVPCFAIGAGAELFHGRIDNTEIPKRIAQAAGWDITQ